MNQIIMDIKVLDEKISGKFTKIPSEDSDTIDKEKEEAISLSILEQQILYSRYLSHINGRQRSYRMRKMSRKDFLDCTKIHWQCQLDANKDIMVEFQRIGFTINA